MFVTIDGDESKKECGVQNRGYASLRPGFFTEIARRGIRFRLRDSCGAYVAEFTGYRLSAQLSDVEGDAGLPRLGLVFRNSPEILRSMD